MTKEGTAKNLDVDNIDVESLLREGLERRRTEAVRVPGGIVDRVRHLNRRRRAARLVLVAAPVAVAIGGIIAVGLNAGLNTPRLPAKSRALQARTAAYIVRQVQHAVADGRGQRIQYAYTVAVNAAGKPVHGYEITWAYGSEYGGTAFSGQGRLRRVDVWDDRVHMAYGLTWNNAKLAQTAVNYDTKTWDRSSQPYDASYNSVRSCRYGRPVDYRAFIRWGLRCGTFRVARHAVINGVRTIEIVNSPRSAGYTLDFWIDPRTYLPVRLEFNTRDTSYPAVFRVDERTDFRWLAPTTVNLAALNVRIPAGFRWDPGENLTNACGFLPCN